MVAANANGHRRRELIRRVLAEETNCALCGMTVNKHSNTSQANTDPNAHAPNAQAAHGIPSRR